MNNINIKSKKTRSLNKLCYVKIRNKYDPFYANIFCLLNSKRTTKNSKLELKIKLAKMYDGNLSVTQSIENDILVIRYSLTSILDQFLPESISNEVDELFVEATSTFEFSDKEILEAARELKLYVKNFYDNKQNIANSKLGVLIDCTDSKLSMEEVLEFYQNPDVEATQKWIKNIKNAKFLQLNFNDGNERGEIQSSTLKPTIKDYRLAPNESIELGLDQAYIAIGLKVSSHNLTINNLANMILGGSVFSKLFKVVREEHSLSYNIRSTLQSENLIRISGGVNNEKLELALAEIDQQLKILKQGDFASEFELAKTSYIESLKRSKSSEMAYLSMWSDSYLKGVLRNHHQVIKEIEEASIEDIIKVYRELEKLATVVVK